ncbi:hypothetical protein [Paraburkholderia sp.]|uniref:hypothetical protein n=1 Tax=Paraburkholderia sp. TaxID=1926495 RepID=UPI0039E658EF
MATLLIETKVVKALQVNVEDLQALLAAVWRQPVTIVMLPHRNLVDMGELRKLEGTAYEAVEYSEHVPFSFAGYAMQEMVNRGELPEGHYLLNLGAKQEHDGGQVKDYVVKLQNEIAARLVAA